MYALLVPCAASFTYIRCRTMKKLAVPATVLKGLSTWIIVCAALVGTLLGQPSVFSTLIIAGLVMGLSGDVSLSLSRPDKTGFIAGIFFFGFGHLCYIVALIIVSSLVPVLVSIPIFAVLYTIFLVILLRKRANLGSMFVPVLVYGIIVVYILSLSLTIPFSVFPLGLILFFAGVLFATSDALLAKNNFSVSAGKPTLDPSAVRREAALLFLYFLAQSLFAVSVFYFV
ncbi:MAG: lysoplasmalogenase [Treponema sp.]|nr:lysoplasmalogenase [Treponema sp.]